MSRVIVGRPKTYGSRKGRPPKTPEQREREELERLNRPKPEPKPKKKKKKKKKPTGRKPGRPKKVREELPPKPKGKPGRPRKPKKRKKARRSSAIKHAFEEIPIGFYLVHEAPLEYDLIVNRVCGGSAPPADLIEQIGYSSINPLFRSVKFRRALINYRRDGLYARRSQTGIDSELASIDARNRLIQDFAEQIDDGGEIF